MLMTPVARTLASKEVALITKLFRSVLCDLQKIQTFGFIKWVNTLNIPQLEKYSKARKLAKMIIFEVLSCTLEIYFLKYWPWPHELLFYM